MTGLNNRLFNASSLIEVLEQRAQCQADKTAYIFLQDGEKDCIRLSYAELALQVKTIAAHLQQLGLQGERAVLLYPQGLDYIIAFFACLAAGVVAVPAYPPKNSRHLPRLQAIIEDSQAVIILSNQATAQMARALYGEGLPWLLTDEVNTNPDHWQKPDINADTLAFLQYTSGSTGSAKGVMVSHGNLMANQQAIKQGFGHDADSTVAGWLPLYHDMGLIGNVMQPLYIGAPVVLMSPLAFLEKPVRWLQAISDYRVHTSGAPNFAFDLCVQKISAEEKSRLDLSSWQVAFNGSEPIHAATLERFANAFAECGFKPEAFYPCYGLAEATLFVTGVNKTSLPIIKAFNKTLLEQHIASDDDAQEQRHLVGCGTVSNHHEIRIVNPDTQTLCQDGTVGEIQFSGASVAQGYWQNAEATNATFMTEQNNRWLRTGDLGFIHQNELFVSGRLKDLIIIRGRNYHPHDIEKAAFEAVTCLNAHSAAAFAVATDGDEKLVLLAELKRSALRQADFQTEFSAIRSRLVEECSIQADVIVFLKPNAVLKTTSGKIRRSACRDLYLQQQLDIVAFDDLTQSTHISVTPSVSNVSPEQTLLKQTFLIAPKELAAPLLANYLATRIAQLSGLAQTQINLSDSILSLGIDSLKAIEFKHFLDEFLNIDFPVTVLLNETSLTQIAEQSLILAQAAPRNTPSTPSNETAVSLGQQALWTVCQVTNTPTLYNMSVALQFDSTLNTQALERALHTLMNRHALLRSQFRYQQTELIRTLDATVTPAFQNVVCLNEQDRQEKISAWLQQPFDLTQDSLLKTAVFRLEQQSVLVFCAHHLVIDARSMTVLLNELQQLYLAELKQKTIDLPPLVSYADYVQWQQDYLNSAAAEHAWGYWQKNLSGEIPKLKLPTQKHNNPSYQASTEALILPLETLHQLKKLAEQQQVTLYVLLLTVFKTLLHRYTGQQDVIVGSPTLGRPKQAFADLVGYFVNPVALRSKPTANKTFVEYLAEVKQTVLAALQHQDYPFSLLVQKLHPERGGVSPFYQTWFMLQPDVLALGLPEIKLNWAELAANSYQLPDTNEQFDLMLMMAESEQGLCAVFTYRRDLFAPSTIQHLVSHWQTLLNAVLNNPSQCLANLSLLNDTDVQQLARWNAATLDYSFSFIHQLVEQHAEKTPNAKAVLFNNQSLTYAELNQAANRLAHYLQARGVRPEQRIAVCLERSLDLIVSLLAILKAGAAYLPIDPNYPLERQRYVLNDAKVSLLISHSALVAQIELSDIEILSVDDTVRYADYSHENCNSAVMPDNTAYIIYTSGSTGQPKGVLVSHANLLQSTLARHHHYSQAVGCYLLLSSFAFDSSVAGIFWTLTQGGSLCLPIETEAKDPMRLGTLIAEQQVTHLLALPSLYAAILSTVPTHKLASLHTVIVAGEACTADIVKQHDKHLKTAEFYNEYGPTEATVWTSVEKLQATDQNISIGKAIANSQIYILDPALNALPVGVTGELYIAGSGITRGYLNRPDLTAEKFIPNPFGHGRLYKTGDLAYFQTDGSLVFVGRLDHQIKLRGYRIECGEIETRLVEQKTVQQAVVLVRDERLVAYLVANAELDISALKNALKMLLPDYMIPSAWLCLEAMPLNANGKVDRKTLLTMELNRLANAEAVAPRDELEEVMADIWKNILGVPSIGIYDDFFDLGGHSLLGVQVVAKVQELFGVNVPVKELFEAPTIAEFVDRVAEYQ